MVKGDFAAKEILSYVLDGKDYIINTNDYWDTFANKTGGKKIVTDNIRQKLIWEFIEGKESKVFYRILFERVRETQEPIRFKYRCDSDDHKRIMEMAIIPLNKDGWINVVSELKAELPQKVEFEIDYTANSEFYTNGQIRCSNCNKFYINDEWVEIEVAVEKYRIVECGSPIKIVNMICEDCENRIINNK